MVCSLADYTSCLGSYQTFAGWIKSSAMFCLWLRFLRLGNWQLSVENVSILSGLRVVYRCINNSSYYFTLASSCYVLRVTRRIDFTFGFGLLVYVQLVVSTILASSCAQTNSSSYRIYFWLRVATCDSSYRLFLTSGYAHECDLSYRHWHLGLGPFQTALFPFFILRQHFGDKDNRQKDSAQAAWHSNKCRLGWCTGDPVRQINETSRRLRAPPRLFRESKQTQTDKSSTNKFERVVTYTSKPTGWWPTPAGHKGWWPTPANRKGYTSRILNICCCLFMILCICRILVLCIDFTMHKYV